MRCIGYKIPVPKKRDEKAWDSLRQSLITTHQALHERAYLSYVKERHDLEKRILELVQKPTNPGREVLIKELNHRLANLNPWRIYSAYRIKTYYR